MISEKKIRFVSKYTIYISLFQRLERKSSWLTSLPILSAYPLFNCEAQPLNFSDDLLSFMGYIIWKLKSTIMVVASDMILEIVRYSRTFSFSSPRARFGSILRFVTRTIILEELVLSWMINSGTMQLRLICFINIQF